LPTPGRTILLDWDTQENSMAMDSINPATGERLASLKPMAELAIERALDDSRRAAPAWAATPIAERAALLHAVARELRRHTTDHARLITLEIGKPIREACAEIEKSAWGCEHFADHAAGMLRDEVIATAAGSSYVTYAPLGTVLAVMPWNFPYWQVFRAAAPALMAGNTVLLKHASNVPQCTLAIEDLFQAAGFPAGVFRALLIDAARAEQLVGDPRIHAVTLTGSEAAGRRVAQAAGAALKKTVLELGGSDAFVVLEDADLDEAANTAVTARFQNSGQSCIAAKRFIVVDAIAGEFLARFRRNIESLKVGDPLHEDTRVGPLARADLRETLHRQVTESVAAGAQLMLGGEPLPGAGWFYAPTLLDRVQPGMPACDEELFGPVAAVLRARDEDHALQLANSTRYGLGASVWTRDAVRGERVARRIETGMGFVNGMVHSDPRLPFGGVKASGYGRELGTHGIREFVNVKTIWIK
jgi:succinate-semialdehyde dehydrogenase/glutarate-semialdehyde dehydrogenase